MEPLTVRQQQVLELITEHIERPGFPPSHRELMLSLGVKSPLGLLKKHNGNIEQAAREADMNMATIYRKIKKYGIRKAELC